MNSSARNIAGILAIFFSHLFFSCASNHQQSAKNNFTNNNELVIAQFNNTQISTPASAKDVIEEQVTENVNTVALVSTETLQAVTSSRKFTQVKSNYQVSNKKIPGDKKKFHKNQQYKKPVKSLNTFSKTKSKGKNQWIALALAVFLGGYGAHRFYLGYTNIAIAQLVLITLSLLTFITAILIIPVTATPALFLILYAVGFILFLINGIWVTIDFINILLGNLQPKNGEYSETIDF